MDANRSTLPTPKRPPAKVSRPMDYPPELGGIIYQVASMARREGGISFAGGYPDPALFDADGLAAGFNQMFRDNFRAALQYGDREGYRPLRERLAAFSSTAQRTIAPEEVIITNGGQQGIEATVRTLTRPGDVVLIDSPSFSTALQVFQLAGLRGMSVACDADGLIPASLEEQARAHRPKLLYVVPSYGNPDGSLLSLERRRRVLELAAEYDFHVLEDDPYSRIFFDAPAPPSLLGLTGEVRAAADRVIHVSSLSKLIAPGLRVGWMIPPAGLRGRFVWTKLSTDIHSAIPTQVAIENYWAGGGFEAHLPAIRETYRERARAMHGALTEHAEDRLEFARPRGGMFMWCRTRADVDTRDLLEAARREKVFFVPGIAFYPGDPDLRTFRLSFATMPPDQIVEGIKRLARIIPAA